MKILYLGVVIVTAAIGLCALIVVRNQPDVLEKAKQKRESGQLQSMEADWWFSRILDEVKPASVIAASADILSTDYEGFETYYTQEVDPWGNPCEVSSGSNLIGYKTVIQIRCFGRDGKESPTKTPYPLGPFVATAYDEDIVWADGFFVRYPAEAQDRP